MAHLFTAGKFQAIGSTGLALPGALLYTYAAGGLTPLATYTNQGGGSSNANPVVCDAAGQADVWFGNSAYRLILKTAAGVTVWDVDNVRTELGSLADTDSPTLGDALVGVEHPGAGAVARTQHDKNQDFVTHKDIGGAAGDYNGTTGADDTAALQAALTHIQSTYDPAIYATNSPAGGSCSLNVLAGNYKVNGTLALTKKVALRGDGPAERSSGARWLQFNNAVDLIQITPAATGMSFSIENMTLAGTAGGAGHLLHVVGGGAACNSGRVLGNFFATPPLLSIYWEKGDDLQIVGNTFDAANASSIALGTTVAGNAVSNANVEDNNFFEIPTRCILLYNAVDVAIVNNRVTRQSASRTEYFVDGYNSLPYQLVSINISDNKLNAVDCIVKATAVDGLTVCDNQARSLGAGAGAALSAIELTGACKDVVITGNRLSGSFDTKNFYNDAAATVTGAAITGNIFINTGGGAGQALVCGNTTGVIANNTFIGFTTPSISQKVTTTGTAINTGAIAAGATWLSAGFTVTGARVGDSVRVGCATGTFPLAAGLTIDGLVTANDTVKFAVRNGTAGSLTPAAFDITYVVERGV